MKLSDTVNMMLSEDSKLRLKGEFYQAKIRYLDLVCSIHDKEKELPVIEAFNNSELESLKKTSSCNGGLHIYSTFCFI